MKRNENIAILIIIVLYVYILLDYIETTKHCKSVLHINNLKYCDEQKQTCMLNFHLGNHINRNAIDEEVKLLVEADIQNNLIQQSLLDAIRCFNVRLENAMHDKP